MLNFCSLYSGSSGNCLFVESQSTKILVDCGTSGKKVCEGLCSIDKNIEDIDAIISELPITTKLKDTVADIKAAAEKAHEDYMEKAEEEAAREAAAQAAAEMAAREKELLAALIFCEAGNQPYEGQVAVGAVVMNRVNSGQFPDTITDVIYQSGQFTPAMTGWLDSVLASDGYTDSAMQAAADALAGSNPIGDCLYFSTGGNGYQLGDHFFR